MCEYCSLLDKDLMLSETFYIEFIRAIPDLKQGNGFIKGKSNMSMNVKDNDINYCFKCGKELGKKD